MESRLRWFFEKFLKHFLLIISKGFQNQFWKSLEILNKKKFLLNFQKWILDASPVWSRRHRHMIWLFNMFFGIRETRRKQRCDFIIIMSSDFFNWKREPRTIFWVGVHWWDFPLQESCRVVWVGKKANSIRLTILMTSKRGCRNSKKGRMTKLFTEYNPPY